MSFFFAILAEIVALPAFFAVTIPFIVTEATFVAEDFHVIFPEDTVLPALVTFSLALLPFTRVRYDLLSIYPAATDGIGVLITPKISAADKIIAISLLGFIVANLTLFCA